MGPAEQLVEHQSGLELGERGAEAEVDAAAERELPVDDPVDVEVVVAVHAAP